MFMSIHINVVTQFKSKSKPFIVGLHYMAHHTNLVVKIVSIQPLVVKLEKLVANHLHILFSPKKYFEHGIITKLLEIKNLKLLHNVKTRRIYF